MNRMHYDNIHVLWNYNMPLWFFILTWLLLLPLLIGTMGLTIKTLNACDGEEVHLPRYAGRICLLLILLLPIAYTIGGILWDGWL